MDDDWGQIIQFNRIFPEINHPAFEVPPIYGKPHIVLTEATTFLHPGSRRSSHPLSRNSSRRYQGCQAASTAASWADFGQRRGGLWQTPFGHRWQMNTLLWKIATLELIYLSNMVMFRSYVSLRNRTRQILGGRASPRVQDIPERVGLLVSVSQTIWVPHDEHVRLGYSA